MAQPSAAVAFRVQGITWPPSITIAWPVTFRASSEAR